MSLYDIRYPDHHGTCARPYDLRMITDLGLNRIGVSPDKVWFQGSSCGAETYKATPLLFAPEIDLRHIRLAYTNNILGLRYLFSELRAT